MKPPRCKRAPVPKGYLPFPINICRKSTVDPHGERRTPIKFVCRGRLNSDCTVSVCTHGDMLFLYHMGFYGKGSLSKHEPVFQQVVTEENVEGIERHLSSVSLERYTCSIHNSVYSKSLYTQDVSPQSFISLAKMGADDLKYHCEGHQIQPNEEVNYNTSLNSVVPEVGKETAQTSLTSATLGNSEKTLVHKEEIKVDKGKMELRVDEVESYDEQLQRVEKEKVAEGLPFVEPAIQFSLDSKDYADWGTDEDSLWLTDKLPETNIESINVTVNDARTMSPPRWLDGKEQHSPSPSPMVGERTLGVDDYEDTSVNSDSSSEEEEVGLSNLDINDAYVKEKKRYYDMKEELILESYEAIFLKLAFDCIQVVDGDNGEAVGMNALWKRCMEDKSFLVRYAVYHHLRAKGWVAKDGLTYGCDFMIYKKGPKYFHSSMGVVVRCCDADSLREVDERNPRVLTWTKLMGLNRIINNVRKELMLCYVLMPANMTSEQLSSPERCLTALTICEISLNRVIPSRERETVVHTSKRHRT
ncbi:tRNA-splicing endonuclease subunit Sen2-like isoform X2 [Watersipora subatra]|uniref:tRNA-splicing endonuclease subunit Sen2-like isoform X2 n=1 Tax=Watersipora subatra TaxID=2589382 RepID=UPI00355B1C34